MKGRWPIAVALAIAISTGVTPAIAAGSARPPGPALRTPTAALAAALHCTSNVATSSKRTVLLVHGTGATPQEDFGGNLAKYLPKAGYPVCQVTVPRREMTDVQINVEYVVWAIRAINHRSGKKVDVIGHSQGAFLPAYALRFWPDLAKKVDDFIGYAGTYTYGTDFAPVICAVVCSAAFRQLSPGSRLLTAVAREPLPSGPSYTALSSALDEIVVPQPKAGVLVAPGARSYRLQDICPADPAEHLFIVYERPFLQLTLDALAHPGPAQRSRVAGLRCGLLPEATGTVPSLLTFTAGVSTGMLRYAVPKEPALRCYLDPACR